MTPRTGNQVLLVRGARRAALYDFRDMNHARIQRIPLPIADRVQAHEDGTSADERRWLAFLLQAGFIDDTIPPYWQPFRPDWSHPFRPALHHVTIDVDATAFDTVCAWLERSTLARGLQYVFHVTRDITPSLAQRMALLVERVAAPGFELFPVDPSIISSLVCDRDGTPIARRELAARDDPSLSATLKPGLFQLQRNRVGAETGGQIHVGADLLVRPHRNEQHYMLGDVRIDEFDDIARGDRLAASNAAGKDLRTTCKDCELRYACLRDFTARTDPADLHSAPADCPYDPHSGEQQAHLFKPASTVATP